MEHALPLLSLRFKALGFLWLCLLSSLISFCAQAQTITTLAGNDPLGLDADAGSATQATYNQVLIVDDPSTALMRASSTDPGNASPGVSVTADGGGTAKASARLRAAEPSPEYQALVDFYNSTNGPNWSRKDNWLTGDSPCGWYGVTCTNGRVTSLDLINNQLSGSIPASLSTLTSLQVLQLSGNQLSGGIPTSFSNLTNLRYLSMIFNQLSGNIPSSLLALTNLQVLELGRNQLSGSIPTDWSALTNLLVLTLFENQLSGSIPASLSTLTNLQRLNLSSNQLSGGVPTSLSALTNLQILILSGNQLSGSIPASLSALTNLQQLDLSGNQLSGSIPVSLSTLTNLQGLSLSGNQLSGSIPASLSALTNVQNIDLGDNQFSGCIPASLSELCKRYVYVNLQGNAGLPDGGYYQAFCVLGLGSDVALATATPNPALVGQTLSLSVTAGSAYRWSGPNGFSATDQRPSLSLTSPQQSGLYSVTVINGATTCRPTATVSLTVNPYPALESGTIYSIQVRHSGKTLDVYGASEADGGRIVQWPANNQVNQKWQMTALDNGYYSLKCVNSGKLLEVYAFQNQDGAQVNQWTSHGGYNQQFKPILTSDGYYYLQARHSQQYLAIEGGSLQDGAYLQQATPTGGTNQQFRFTRVDQPSARLASDAEEKNSLVAYPNPARDRLRVEGTVGSQVRLVDGMGRVRAQGVMSKGGWEVDVSAFGPGMYGVQLQEGQRMVTRKVVIAH